MLFSTDFPSGNGKMISAVETQLGWEISFLAQSKAGEPQPLWFFFRLEGLTGERVRLNLANSVQCLGNQEEWGHNRPVYRFDGSPWRRVAHAENRLNALCCWETWFEVPLEEPNLEFAFCYPYPGSQLEEVLKDCPGFAQAVIGYSHHDRPIIRLTNGMEEGKPGIYVLARQHASEVSGAWELDGMLRYLSSKEGKEAREAFSWWIVPFVDVDGVEEGFYGKDQRGGDLNRSWADWFAQRVELTGIERDMHSWQKKTKAHMLLDLHSPAHEEVESYFVVHADTGNMHRQELRRLWTALNQQLREAGLQEAGFHEQPPGRNTSAQTGLTAAMYAHRLGINACTYECTYQGERDRIRYYSIEDYQKIGACMVKAICQTLK